MTSLMHCGSVAADLARLHALPTPEPRGTAHYPIPHAAFTELVLEEMVKQNFDIIETKLYLNRGHDQLFGLARLAPEGPLRDLFQPVVGFRNSHDMSMSAGIALGMRVFVCDNMCFSGEIVFHRKHTARIMNDLPPMIQSGVTRLKTIYGQQEDRSAAYRNTLISESDAARILLEAHALKLVNATKIRDVWTEFRTDPLEYDCGHKVASYWRLYNAITHHWKQSPAQLIGPIHHKSAALHALLDDELAHA